MDLALSPEREARRAEAREWLQVHAPRAALASMDTEAGSAQHREWERVLADAGWSVVQWPEEYGGRGYDLLDWLIFEEEYYAAGAPARINHNGLTLLGASLLEHGTPAQRDRLLPEMVSGRAVWAQAWSEPGAGSDLASVTAKATRVEGGYRLTGQKVWSSRAAIADHAFGLFRSDPGSSRHRGLTYVMFDLRGPGVQVRPIQRFDGDPVFAEIFLDDCFVPDEDVIGEPEQGWSVVMSTAAKERGVSLRSPGRFVKAANDLVELWRLLPERGRAIHAAAVRDAWSRAQAYRMSGFLAAEGRVGPEEASMGKLFWSEMDLTIHETALEIIERLRREAPSADLDARHEHWLSGFRFALAGPIYAGTNQIQKNIIAERLLGLPRS